MLWLCCRLLYQVHVVYEFILNWVAYKKKAYCVVICTVVISENVNVTCLYNVAYICNSRCKALHIVKYSPPSLNSHTIFVVVVLSAHTRLMVNND